MTMTLLGRRVGSEPVKSEREDEQSTDDLCNLGSISRSARLRFSVAWRGAVASSRTSGMQAREVDPVDWSARFPRQWMRQVEKGENEGKVQGKKTR